MDNSDKAMSLSQDELHLVGFWAADCAERALPDTQRPPLTHALVTLDQAKHVLGPAVYAARELVASDDPGVGDEEIRWAIKNASPTVCVVMRRFSARSPGRTRLNALLHQLDAGLRR